MTAVRASRVRLYGDEAFIDGFAGGGGASTGAEMALGVSPDVAINHDREALAMHQANHPKTRHIRTNIKTVNFKRAMRGTPVGGAWFSPDCTYHSKARGGKPFRDRNKARRIRGLAWEMVRCAIQVRPRVLFMENVEEIEFWGPLDNRGVPIPAKRGTSWLRFVARLRNLGYVCEWRRLRAKGHGAPTTRTRLFFIARCDGQPIVWPKETHGPALKPYRTAAECIDFGLPVPSIFLTKAQAKAWGKANGVSSPKRPLALATQRRIARGIMRFVLKSPEPFIIAVRHQGDSHVYSVHEPLRTIAASDREFALITPILAGVGGRKGQSPETRVDQPYHTITAKADTALIVPSLVRIAHGERDANGKKRGKGEHSVTEPLPTQTASNEFALVAPILTKFQQNSIGQDARHPIDTVMAGATRFGLIAATLVNTRNGERLGQAPRVYDIREPFGTITAHGSQGALVAAFLAKHNGGHEATGHTLTRPMDAIVCRENKALVTSHLVKLRGGLSDHVLTSQDVREPAPTLTAGGTPIAEVRAFLVKYAPVVTAKHQQSEIKYEHDEAARCSNGIDPDRCPVCGRERIHLEVEGDSQHRSADLHHAASSGAVDKERLPLCDGSTEGRAIQRSGASPRVDSAGRTDSGRPGHQPSKRKQAGERRRQSRNGKPICKSSTCVCSRSSNGEPEGTRPDSGAYKGASACPACGRPDLRADRDGAEHLTDQRVQEHTLPLIIKYFGTGVARRVDVPLDTVTTKERFGLVTVTIAGEEYVIVDIGMRMLTPRELFLCQGFPITYKIDCTVKLPGQPRKRLTKKAQTRLVGNSVPPQLAAALIGANYVQARRHQRLPLEVVA